MKHSKAILFFRSHRYVSFRKKKLEKIDSSISVEAINSDSFKNALRVVKDKGFIELNETGFVLRTAEVTDLMSYLKRLLKVSIWLASIFSLKIYTGHLILNFTLLVQLFTI